MSFYPPTEGALTDFTSPDTLFWRDPAGSWATRDRRGEREATLPRRRAVDFREISEFPKRRA